MKKLSLILCACAIAVAGLSVSCKNETVERKNVGYKNYLNSYTISGTITTVVVNKEVDTDGTTVLLNDTITTTTTIEAGTAKIEWRESKTYSTNGVEYTISSITTKGKQTKKTKDKAGTEDPYSNDYTDASLTNAISTKMVLQKIGKKYYVTEDLDPDPSYTLLVPVSEGFECADLDSGKDFTLSFTVTEKENNNGWVDKDDKSEDTTTTTTTYDIKFTAK